jgi:hypothetical protein
MAYVDFTSPAWDETDEGNDITVAANKVTFTSHDNTDKGHVSDEDGHQSLDLTGNFRHKFECQLDAQSGTYPENNFWGVAEAQEDQQEMVDGSRDALLFRHYTDKFYVNVWEDGSVIDTDSTASITLGTTYYVTVEYVLSTKTLTAEIHTGAHHPAGTHVDLLTATGSAGVTLNYVFAYMSKDHGGSGTASGFTQNLEYGDSGIMTLMTSYWGATYL